MFSHFRIYYNSQSRLYQCEMRLCCFFVAEETVHGFETYAIACNAGYRRNAAVPLPFFIIIIHQLGHLRVAFALLLNLNKLR